MITMTDSNRFGVAGYSITSTNDLNNLPKKGLTTGSTAILYGTDGSLRIWNFVENEDKLLDGQWIEMK